MIKFLKYLKIVIPVTLFVLLISVLCVYGAYVSYQAPTYKELSAIDNISKGLQVSERQIVKKSRQSTVRVLSVNPETGNIASSTGTYITAFRKYYVLTVMHGIISDCENTKILIEGDFIDCLRFVALDVPNDYAIIELEDEIENRKPIRVLRDIPRGQQWKKNLSVMTGIYYTGFPNTAGPLTFSGKVSGVTSDEYIYIDSYAWSGASGSGIFSENGKLIGYIVAIDVGATEFGAQVLENIIFVVPTYRVDWAFLFR